MSVKSHLRTLFLLAAAAYGISLQSQGQLFQKSEIRAQSQTCEAKLATNTPCTLYEQRSLSTMEQAGYKDLKGLFLVMAVSSLYGYTGLKKAQRGDQQPAPSVV